MTDIIARASVLLELSSHGWITDPEATDLVQGLVAALKAARAENERINGVLDALENRIKIERLRSRDRAAVDGELARLREAAK